MSDTEKRTGLKPATAMAGLAVLLLAACTDGQQAATGQCAGATGTIAALEPLVRGDVAALNLSDTPVPLPLFEFSGQDGSRASTADYKGKTLLLNLWATWCAPCREEMPALDRLQAELGDERFQVLPISIDRGGPEKPLGFFQEIGVVNLPFHQDATMGIFNELKKMSLAFGLPVTLLVDEQGCILGSLNGPADWSGKDALELLRAAKERRN